MAITNSTISLDQEKFLVNKLLDRSSLRLVMAGVCDSIQMREGAGLTAYMVRYKRMNVPVTTLSEGVTPSQSSFSLQEVTVTLDQWGDYLEVTDVAQLTVKHPLMQQCTELLADNAARVMDREITLVMLAGTNVQYGDGTVTARSSVTSSMKISDTVLGKARVTLVNAGAPPRGGPSKDAKQVAASGNFANGLNYVAICGPEVIQDVMSPSTSFGTFAAAATYNNAKQLYSSEVGTWLGFRFVETNFIPKLVRLGNATVAAAEGSDVGGITGLTLDVQNGASGALASSTTFYWQVTRKDLLRGFEEAISIVHSTATGVGDDAFVFTMPSTAGFVYNVYFGTTATNLKLHAQNVAASGVTTVNSVPATGASYVIPLQATGSGDPSALHPVFIVAESALAWCGFYKAKMLVSPNGATKDDPLAQRRTIGFKFFGKAVIKDQDRLLRLEVASTY